MLFFKIHHLHFVGIGGSGMNGIAEVLLDLGYSISGSDKNKTDITERLRRKGAYIAYEHSAQNVEGASVVIVSSAISEDNVEVLYAKKNGIPVIKRAEMLAELIRLKKYGVCVAGTHGKTTTTSMIGMILSEAKFDPTIVIGGILKSIGSGARLGSGNFIVAEADEFDQSFLQIIPTLAVITHLEKEHLECYDNDMEKLKEAFVAFANKVPFYGAAVLSIEEENVQSIIPYIRKKYYTYGFMSQADYRAVEVVYNDDFTSEFSVLIGREKYGRINLKIPGEHNVKNALAAIAIADIIGIDFSVIKTALEKFTGVKRRFEIKYNKNNIIVVDDYAHHPTEVKKTLEAASLSRKKIIAIFQPHLYSRTLEFADDFGKSFGNADEVIITSIHPSREKPIEGVSAELVYNSAKLHGHKDVVYIPQLNDIPEYVMKKKLDNTLIISLGAGSVYKVSDKIVELLEGNI